MMELTEQHIRGIVRDEIELVKKESAALTAELIEKFKSTPLVSEQSALEAIRDTFQASRG